MSIPNAGPDIPYVTTVPTSYIGPSVSVAGVLKMWDGGGYSPRVAADITALRAQTKPTIYVETDLPRILGSGRFKVAFVPDLNDWIVVAGQSPVRLSAEVLLTASGTSYVQMANALVGSVIGDNETWIFRASARNNGVYAATGSPVVRCGGNATNIGSGTSITAANARGRRVGLIRRYGSQIQRVAGQPEVWQSATTFDLTVSDFSTFNIECGVIPGASGDTYVLEEFVFLREA